MFVLRDRRFSNQSDCLFYSFWVSVKAVTLILISERGSVISSAHEGKSASIYLVK